MAGKADLFGTSGLTFGVNKNPHGANSSGSGGAGIGVNAYLWRGALDTLSFMPLSSADPFGGVIITDWYQPPGDTGERYKGRPPISSARICVRMACASLSSSR